MKKMKPTIVTLMLTAVLILSGFTVYAGDMTAPEKIQTVSDVPEEILLEDGQTEAFEEEAALLEEQGETAEENVVELKQSMDADAKSSLAEAPATPKLKSAKSVSNGITVTWKEVEGADFYRVYRWDSTEAAWKRIGTATKTTFTDKKVESGTKTYYTVSAVGDKKASPKNKDGIAGVYLSAVKPEVKIAQGKVRISWAAVEGAQGYKVCKRVKGTSKWKELAQTTETSCLTKGYKSGTDYEFTVRAFLNWKDKEYLSYLGKSVVTGVFFPITPVLKEVVCKEKGLEISWESAENAASYEIYRKTEGGSFQKIAKTTACTYLDKLAQTGTVYYYSVAVCDDKGNIGFHNSTGIAGAYFPEIKIVSIENNGGIELEWNSAKGADGYELFRKCPGSSYEKAAEVPVTQYIDKDTVSGKKYAYYVRAYKTIGEESFPGYANAANRALILKLDTPTITVTPTAEKTLVVTWPQVDGASAYDIYRKNPSNGNWDLIKSTKGLTYTEKKAVTGKIYTYSVTCRKGSYKSGFSQNGVAGVYLDAPVMKSAKSAETGILVKWNAVEKADGYRLLRKVPGGKWKTVGYTTNTKMVDTTVTVGIKYSYVVKGYVLDGSTKVCGICDTSQAVKRFFTHPVQALIKSRLDACGGTLQGAYKWTAGLPDADQPESKNLLDYGYYSFKNQRGNCFGRSAAFCLMARELGYEAELVCGTVKMTSGESSKHAWVELSYDGYTYVCDPEYEFDTGSSGYLLNYGQYGTWVYQKDHIIE